MRTKATTRHAAISAVACLAQVISAVPAWAGGGELTQVALTRTAAGGFQLSTTLSKNVYRYVERQESYTVQVPYTVEVPYQVEETYYTHEQFCEVVPRSHEVCRNEQRCEVRPRRECHEERRCHGLAFSVAAVELAATARPAERPGHGGGDHHGGGGNHGGGDHHGGGGNHGGGCTTEQVCHNVLENVCHTQPVCHVETRPEQVCRIVDVPHTRLVTRIRTETYYRTEERVRTVTDQIFDHQWGVAVNVLFPQEASLQGEEAEAAYVQLAGSENAPDVNVSVDSPVFSYRVAGKQVDGRTINVYLELVAKYQPADLGTQTVTGLSLVRAPNNRFAVRFIDAGQAARVATRYSVRVTDRDLNQVVFEQTLDGAIGMREVTVPVTTEPNPDHDQLVSLSVSREGIVLAGRVQFDQQLEQLAQLDPKPYIDPNGVRDFVLVGSGDGSSLVFTDASPVSPLTGRVVTTYEIAIKTRVWGYLRKNTLTRGTFDRAKLVASAGKVGIPMGAFPGLDQAKLRDLFKPGSGYYLEVTVRRVSARLVGYSPVAFQKEAEIRVAGGRRGD